MACTYTAKDSSKTPGFHGTILTTCALNIKRTSKQYLTPPTLLYSIQCARACAERSPVFEFYVVAAANVLSLCLLEREVLRTMESG